MKGANKTRVMFFQVLSYWSSSSEWIMIIIKKTLWPIFKDGVQLSQDYRTYTTKQFNFYHKHPRSSWYSFDWALKYERFERVERVKRFERVWGWKSLGGSNHPMIFNLRLLVLKPSALTTNHENKNQMSTLNTRMKGKSSLLLSACFYCNHASQMLMKCCPIVISSYRCKWKF